MQERQETEIDNGGLRCNDVLKCLQITFEHELIHALIDCFCAKEATNKQSEGTWKGKTTPSDGHSRMFMSILNNTFGHTDYLHRMESSVKDVELEATRDVVKATLTKGDTVIYTNHRGEERKAILIKKNPSQPEIKFIDTGKSIKVNYWTLKKVE